MLVKRLGFKRRFNSEDLNGQEIKKLCKKVSDFEGKFKTSHIFINFKLGLVETSNYEDAINALRVFDHFAKLASKIGLLTSEDIDRCETSIDALVESLKLAEILSCKVKVHIMMKHLIPFMRKNKCLASMCEEGLESIHSQFQQFSKRVKRSNNLKQLLICTRN